MGEAGSAGRFWASAAAGSASVARLRSSVFMARLIGAFPRTDKALGSLHDLLRSVLFMRLLPALLVLPFATAAFAQPGPAPLPQPHIAYPATARGDVVVEQLGQRLDEPYR